MNTRCLFVEIIYRKICILIIKNSNANRKAWRMRKCFENRHFLFTFGFRYIILPPDEVRRNHRQAHRPAGRIHRIGSLPVAGGAREGRRPRPRDGGPDRPSGLRRPLEDAGPLRLPDRDRRGRHAAFRRARRGDHREADPRGQHGVAGLHDGDHPRRALPRAGADLPVRLRLRRADNAGRARSPAGRTGRQLHGAERRGDQQGGARQDHRHQGDGGRDVPLHLQGGRTDHLAPPPAPPATPSRRRGRSSTPP